mmetsp:Transcript_71345/g.144884  ORF Transcript_71345/g.144884 Transcript_71345/m.144884 type:complete len:522 (-) Transcript_71345:1558-3123(-)
MFTKIQHKSFDRHIINNPADRENTTMVSRNKYHSTPSRPGKRHRRSKEKLRIAVTGANGFIGSHCVIELLKEGFHVVAVVRDFSASKTTFLKEEAAKIKKEDSLSFRQGNLLESGSYDEAFSDVWGVLHAAAITESKRVMDPYKSIVKPLLNGTENVIKSVKKNANNIKRYVHMSSIGAIMSFDKPPHYIFGENDWNGWSTVERGDPYCYAKTASERCVWDDQELQKSVETIVAINPTVVIGPAFTRRQVPTKSSAAIISGVLEGTKVPNNRVWFVDVRDVAQGVRLAFTRDKRIVGSKRFILNATGPMRLLELNRIVRKSHPQAKGLKQSPHPIVIKAMLRLVKTLPFLKKKLGYTEMWETFGKKLHFDNSRSLDVLGLNSYRDFDDTCEDAANSIQELFSAVKKIDIPQTPPRHPHQEFQDEVDSREGVYSQEGVYQERDSQQEYDEHSQEGVYQEKGSKQKYDDHSQERVYQEMYPRRQDEELEETERYKHHKHQKNFQYDQRHPQHRISFRQLQQAA